MRGLAFTTGNQPEERVRVEPEAPVAGVVRVADTQPEVGPEGEEALEEEAAQAAEGDPAGVVAPVVADISIVIHVPYPL